MTARRRAVVTGAAVRVGRAIALELARSGFDLALHFRTRPADDVLAECRAAGADAFAIRADLADPAQIDGVVREVTARWDSLDLLVNNASIFEPRAFEAIRLDEWDHMLAVNLRAPFQLSQGLLPVLRAAADGALVVHLCDIGADDPVSGFTHYSVSKAGLVMLVKAMAVELAPAVRTVGISPGQVAWPVDYEETKRAALARRIPMKRVGTPEDVARLVRFLALEAPYVNGAVIPVDGGLSVRY